MKHKNCIVGLSLLALLPLGGCQIANYNPGPAPVVTSPLIVDEAMQSRDWEPTAANYQNDVITGNPIDWTLAPRSKGYTSEGVLDTVTFVGNILLLPYAVVKDHPWETAHFKTMNLEPTYSGNPPLPKSPVAPIAAQF